MTLWLELIAKIGIFAAESSKHSQEPANISAEEQGGQELDPAYKNEKSQETEGSENGNAQEDTAEVKDAAEEDQGGREFEPLPVKRILVD